MSSMKSTNGCLLMQSYLELIIRCFECVAPNTLWQSYFHLYCIKLRLICPNPTHGQVHMTMTFNWEWLS